MLKDDGLSDSRMPRGDQLDLVERFAALYETNDLIHGGATPPLWKCCKNSDECWQQALDARPKPPDGGISLPWVGPEYEPDGVLVLGMNFNDASGAAMGFKLANYELSAFPNGKKRMTYDHPALFPQV